MFQHITITLKTATAIYTETFEEPQQRSGLNIKRRYYTWELLLSRKDNIESDKISY
jgi:hypothetical protein